MGSKQSLQPPESAARPDETAPRTHQHVNRRQRPRHQHIGSDHAARRQLPINHQQRACAQSQRLLRIADELAPRRDTVRDRLRPALQFLRMGMAPRPVRAQVVHHAHGLQHLGIAQFALQVSG